MSLVANKNETLSRRMAEVNRRADTKAAHGWLSDEETAAIVAAVRKGKSRSQIALDWLISERHVSRIAVAHGIVRKSKWPAGFKKIDRKAYLQRSILLTLRRFAAHRFISAPSIAVEIPGARSAAIVGQTIGCLRGWIESRKGPGGGYRLSNVARAWLAENKI